jgi:hypothetical protein
VGAFDELVELGEGGLVGDVAVDSLRQGQHDLGSSREPEKVADIGVAFHVGRIPTGSNFTPSNIERARATIPQMPPRDERAIRNEALFREVNVHIADLEERVHATGELLPLVCECVRTGCSAPLEVEPSVFNRVRENPLQFLVAPGHEELEVESVVERRTGYLIVEKHGD